LDGYTQIHSGTLRKLFGAQYTEVINKLLTANLLEKNLYSPDGDIRPNGYFSEKNKDAKSYRIPNHLRSGDKLFTRIKINQNNKLVVKKLHRINNVAGDMEVQSEYYRNLIIASMDKLVLLDNNETHKIIEDHYLKRGVPYSPDLATAIIDQFNHSPFQRVAICPFGGRLHAILMRTIKSLRPQVRHEDYLDIPFVEIDIVASQPWFLSIVSPNLIRRFAPECSDAIPYFEEVEKEKDVIKFRKLCARKPNGIYEHLRDKYNAKYGENFTRNKAKSICFRAFFSDYSRKEKLTVAKCERSLKRYEKQLSKANAHRDTSLSNDDYEVQMAAEQALTSATKRVNRATKRLFTQKCYELFKEEFENMHRLFWNIKKLKWDFERGCKNGETPKYYANNALLAQRLESGIVYTVVAKALFDNNITRIATIHDSFMVPVNQEAKARKVIKKAFDDLGLKPRFN
jgi:hypothetical protein